MKISACDYTTVFKKEKPKQTVYDRKSNEKEQKLNLL